VNPSLGESASAPIQPSADPIRNALGEIVSWSQGLPEWQRDALRRLYAQSELTTADLDELFILCRQTHDLLEANEAALTPQPLDASHVPAVINTGTAVALKSIGRAKNVNALANDQTLEFAETGLTIVYGDNGSGKSGYGRVLKRACRARDHEEILPNAFETAGGRPSAQIKYSVGSVLEPEVAWDDGVTVSPSLSNISVFDARCAAVHVDGTNELAYTPVPLELLQSLADTCLNFGNRLRKKKAAIETQLPSFRRNPSCHEGTAVTQILDSLSATTALSAIHSLVHMSAEEKGRFERLKRDLALDPAKEIRKIKARKMPLEELTATAAKSDEVLASTTAEQLNQLLQAAKDKATAAQLAATNAFSKEPLPQAGSEIWKTLWEAARAFSIQEGYLEHPFPNTDPSAVCVLCQQPLSSEARNRLEAFEKFVREKVQQAAQDAKHAVRMRKDDIRKRCVSNESLQEIVRLLRDDLDEPQICKDVVRNLTRARVRGRKLIAATDPIQLGTARAVTTVSTKLANLVARLDERIGELEKTADPEQRTLQEGELHSFEDRIWLEITLPDIESEIERLKKIAAFEKAINDTDTTRITRKTTDISRILVTNTIRDAFAAEIAGLNIADRRIELTQEPSGYGATKFKVSLIRNPKAKAASILSEGEHRCVALAAFLAELSTAQNRSGVIFDDPVSSLDHNYREALATRLVKEAATGRQVIVFTHDIPFLMMLDDEARKQGQVPHYESVSRAEDRAGICARGAPFKAKTVPEIIVRLDKWFNTTTALHASGRLDEWSDKVKAMAGFLRDGWERAAETYVAPVVRRYDNKVRPGGLRQLTVLTDQDFAEFNEGYEFACTYCHTDSPPLNRPVPTPTKLKAELDRLRKWFDGVRTRQDQKK
jgi:energy-coupling factor transporter ATP-binding protein EcfA2